MEETRNSIDKAYSENKEQIEKEIFNLALEGIANGQMDYSKDPILPYVVQTIQKTVEKFEKISPEEQNKMIKLTVEQLDGTVVASGSPPATDVTEVTVDGLDNWEFSDDNVATG